MSKETLVLYHGNCTDGFGAALAAYTYLKDRAEYVPCFYGKINTVEDLTKLPSLNGKVVYVLDFSFSPEVMKEMINRAKRFIWLDHHQSAIEDWCGKDYLTPQVQQYRDYEGNKHIYLDNCHSGAVLAWEHFRGDTPMPDLYYHIQDRDLWQWKFPATRDVMAAIRSYPEDFSVWEHFLDNRNIDFLKTEGKAINRQTDSVLEELSANALKITTDMALAVVCNAPGSYASELGNKLLQDNPDCLLAVTWYLTKDPNKVGVSFRSRKGGFNCATLAKSFGGGGHQGAAGCSWTQKNLLDFLSTPA